MTKKNIKVNQPTKEEIEILLLDEQIKENYGNIDEYDKYAGCEHKKYGYNPPVSDLSANDIYVNMYRDMQNIGAQNDMAMITLSGVVTLFSIFFGWWAILLAIWLFG